MLSRKPSLEVATTTLAQRTHRHVPHCMRRYWFSQLRNNQSTASIAEKRTFLFSDSEL